MKFTPLSVDGAWLVGVERHTDERGFFARTWCAQEFADHGVQSAMVQASASWNAVAGTLRGLHFSRPPAREGKLVRCVRGRVHDVIVDLRPGSNSFMQHAVVVLDDQLRNAVFIPPGVAHGFQSLLDDCEVHYLMTEEHRPELAEGVRYDDPAFAVAWPLPVTTISDRDLSFAAFDRERHRMLFANSDRAS